MEPEALDVMEQPTPIKDIRSTRRDAVKVGAAIAVGVAAAGYVKPSLRSLGVPVALAVSGALPPPGSETAACTPGYWGNSPKGLNRWDDANDPEWGGVLGQPYTTQTVFGSYFARVQAGLPSSSLMDQVMVYFASNGATSDWVEKAGRDVVAGTLNAFYFGSAFTYTASQIQSAWTGAVNTYNASGGTDISGFEDLHNNLGLANQNAQCPL